MILDRPKTYRQQVFSHLALLAASGATLKADNLALATQLVESVTGYDYQDITDEMLAICRDYLNQFEP